VIWYLPGIFLVFAWYFVFFWRNTFAIVSPWFCQGVTLVAPFSTNVSPGIYLVNEKKIYTTNTWQIIKAQTNIRNKE
jgi:hypothetical protein